MTSTPLVTVLMPVFNGERYLAQALESVREQTYKNLEILLIDDGSTDGSGEILDRFAQSERRAVVIHKQNTGLIDTLNIGLNLAKGHWLARLDSDDIAHPMRVERQLSAATRDEETVLIGSDFSILREESFKTKRYRLPSSHDRLVRRLRRMQNFFPHSSAMFHIGTVQRIGGYDNSAVYNEDWDLWLRLSDCGRVISIQESLVTIRKHQDQMTRNSGSVIPPGEAFISTVIHLMRSRMDGTSISNELRSEEFRALIKSTNEYQSFCQTLLVQQKLAGCFEADRAFNIRFARLLRQLIRPQTLRAVRYSLIGTSSPVRLANSVIADLITT